MQDNSIEKQDDEILRRLTDLESMFMHMQKNYESLNEVVLNNSNRLDRIMTTLNDINRKVESSLATGTRRPEDEKPPHY